MLDTATGAIIYYPAYDEFGNLTADSGVLEVMFGFAGGSMIILQDRHISVLVTLSQRMGGGRSKNQSNSVIIYTDTEFPIR
jgi:zinc transporter ZupT